MKIKLIALLLVLFTTYVFAQQTTPVLIISEKLCIIYVDGVEKGNVEANKPLLLNLNLGEHYFQAKRDGEVFTQILKCEDNKQKVIEVKLGTQQSTNAIAPISSIKNNTSSLVVIMDNDVKLPGLIQQNEAAPVQFYYSFDRNDTLTIKSGQNGEAGTNNFYVYSYPQNQQIFFKERINGTEEKFIIPQKGVYKIIVTTNYFSSKNSRLKIARSGNTAFNHIPLVKSDTVFTQLNDIAERLETNGFYKGISLPKGTTFWVYWIGIGEESKVKYDTFKDVFSKMNKGKNANPLYAFGTGIINELPTYNNSGKIMDYYFTDNTSALMWSKGLNSKTYAFKNGKAITSDFAIVREIPNELNLLVKTAAMKGQFVNMKIGAFTVTSFYSIAE